MKNNIDPEDGRTRYRVGVDVGGTFTDFYALDETRGAVHTGKRPSTPDNPARAIIEGSCQPERASGKAGFGTV